MEHRIAILEFTRGAVYIFTVFIPEGMNPEEWVTKAYGSNVQYMIDPEQINVQL